MHTISKDWVGSRTAYHFNDVEPKKTALLAIDLQVAFVEPGQPFAVSHAAGVVANINRLCDAIRKAGGTVVFTKHRCPMMFRTLFRFISANQPSSR